MKAPQRFNPPPATFIQKWTTGTLVDYLEVEFKYHPEGGKTFDFLRFYPGWTYSYKGVWRETTVFTSRRFDTLLEALVGACVDACASREQEAWRRYIESTPIEKLIKTTVTISEKRP